MSEGDESYLHHLRGLFDASEENFHEKIYDFFPGIIYVYNAESKKLRYVNKKITDVLGFSYDDIKTWDNEFNKIIFKDDVEVVQQELDKFNTLKDEDSHSYRCRFNRKEGDWMHFNVMGKILRRDAQGKVISLLLVAQDINDQIKSHEELKVIRELAEDNEELLQFGNWNLNPKTNQLKWSRGMYILMDYNPDVQQPDITLDLYLSHIVETDRENLAATFERAGRNKDIVVEAKYTVITDKNNEKIFYSKGKVIYNDAGDVKNIVGITRDISEPTRLYDNLDNYRRMILEKEEFLTHGSWEWDLTDKSVTWSDGMYRLFGYNPDVDKSSINPVNLDFHNHHLSLEPHESGSEHMTPKKNEDNHVWDYEVRLNTGETRTLESFGKVLRDRLGNGIKIIGTTRDVTQLRKYEHELEEKIKELDRSNKELEDFAYAASHDLQEPLRKIATLGDRLQQKFGNDLQEDGKKYIDRIQQATKSARSLIDSLMEFSRIGQESQTFAATNLNDIIRDVMNDLELKIEETKTIFQYGELPVLEISPLQLKQLFFNLILNSLKFRRPEVDPVIILRSKALSKAEIQNYHLNTKLEYFSISVQDNGIGFEEEYQLKIFQMFHRLHGKAEYPGAGIGLALCKRIVEQHKGLIFAKGNPGEGATFTVILPEKHI